VGGEGYVRYQREEKLTRRLHSRLLDRYLWLLSLDRGWPEMDERYILEAREETERRSMKGGSKRR
jgi:hypothetical protein